MRVSPDRQAALVHLSADRLRLHEGTDVVRLVGRNYRPVGDATPCVSGYASDAPHREPS